MHPLIDGDGACTLIYDLERAAVLEVPQELQLHVAPALETGDLDDDLLSWLVNEDLLTTESWAGWGGSRDSVAGEPGWWSLWAIHRFDDEVHARVHPPAESDVKPALESVFKQSFGVSRVQLLLDWEGGFPAAALVNRVVIEAQRRAASAHQEVSFELVLDAHQVTRSVAAFLAASPLHVRLRCGGFPASDGFPEERCAWEASAASVFLLRKLSDRVNVQCSLDGNARLLDLWAWAQRAGVRHLDPLRSEGFPLMDALPAAARVLEYKKDLQAICDEMAAELAARRSPIDYRPLTRMVRRLMASEACCEPESELADDFDRGRRMGYALWPGLGDEAASAVVRAETAEEDLSPCRSCWARSVCNHSTLLASPVGEAPQEPSSERCAVWLAEAEIALRLYHRLAQCDPLDVLRLLGDAARMPLDPLGRREDLGSPKQLF
jgi:hypothetical protein